MGSYAKPHPVTNMTNNVAVFDIGKLSSENDRYRKMIVTGPHLQVTHMTIDDQIGPEVHEESDQTFIVLSGSGVAVLGKDRFNITDGDFVFVPAGVKHDIVSIGGEAEPLKLLVHYSTAVHGEKEDRTLPPWRVEEAGMDDGEYQKLSSEFSIPVEQREPEAE